jgi:hypothetical protein
MMDQDGRFPAHFDFDLHGFVGVRLVDALPQDAEIVARQLGPIQNRLDREPDIFIRFVDNLSMTSQVRFLGLDDAGFTDDAFLILRSKYKAPTKVQISFEKIGQQCEIVCERGLLAVPHLIPTINLTALNKGYIPLHASAFLYKGSGVLVTGWAKGGKTEMLLAFMSNGAQYIGDEWVYLSPNGQKMYGIPEPIKVWDWHLQYLPEYQTLLKRMDRARLWGLRTVVNVMEGVLSNPKRPKTDSIILMRRIQPLLRNQMFVNLTPQKLFGQDGRPSTAIPETIFFVASHESPEVLVSPIESQEIAERMVFSLQEERKDFMSAYLKFRFAFPDLRNELIEESEEIQRKLLMQALIGKRSYAVFHPYPVDIPGLFEAVDPLL